MFPFRPPQIPPQFPLNRANPFMPFQQQPLFPTQPRGIGRLLGRLLGGNGARPMNHFNGMANRGFPPLGARGMFNPSTLSGFGNSFGNLGAPGAPNMISGISGMLNNVQKAIGLVQQFGPMVQQYGPLIKNMPAMLKIMKELNSSDETDSSEDKSEDEANATTKNLPEKDPPTFSDKSTEKRKEKIGLSKPKIYI